MVDALGDRMKLYEGAEAGRRATPLLPVLARLDGKNFSSFTRGLRRPYDGRLSALMVEVTRLLVEETCAAVGYTQSDEITLAFYSDRFDSQIYFDGRVQKMTSVLAATCSVLFNRRLPAAIPEKADLAPVFDCRVWTVPTLTEAANAFLWREQDATKNSVSMAAQAHYGHKALMNKNGAEKQQMLYEKGVNWNDYPASFKRGTYVRRRTIRSRLSVADLESLPPLHNARRNPDAVVERTVCEAVDMPPLGRVANRVEVLFYGEEPRVQDVS